MSSIFAALSSVINGKRDFCCLCLKSVGEESIRLTDDAVININNEDCDIAVQEVLNSLFDEEMYSYITTLNSICEQCTKLAISYYKFLQTSQKNAEYFTNILNGITNSVQYTTNKFDCSKSLFVSLNMQDFTSKHYYDSKCAPTPKAALKRFHKLDNTKKIKVEKLLRHTIKKEKDVMNTGQQKKSRIAINIRTRDMLYDKNNPNNFKCKECLKEYPTIWNLRNHYIRVHAPKKFKCSECPKSYGSAALLESHRSESHCTVVCSECGKTFYNRHTFRVHELGHNLTLVCQDCGRVYKNRATFNKHKKLNVCGRKSRADPSDAQYTCDYCNKKYTQKMSLRVHIQYEHGDYKAHICEWCGKKFWAQSRLKAHIVKHTQEKNYSCTVCGGKFVSKESLLYHTRIHTGEKPYKCLHCDYTFLSASRRSGHMKRYHLGGTLECEICNSKFTTRTYLRKHKRIHMKLNTKTNLTYGTSKTNITKPNYLDQSKSLLPKLHLSPDINSTDIWKIDELDEVGMESFQSVIEPVDIEIQDFCNGDYVVNEIQASAEDDKVYLEVSDDPDDFIKLAGIGS